MQNSDGFYTLKGYERNTEAKLTSAMEDYLEMIARLTRNVQYVRVSELSKMLHVKPSSVTKMVENLNQSGYIRAEKYGEICLTEKGKDIGSRLLYRHQVIYQFLCALNHTSDELEQTEKIEHFLNSSTVENLRCLTEQLKKENPPSS